MVGRPPPHPARHPVEAQILEVKRVEKGIDHAYRIALIHPVIKAFRQQRRLATIRRFNKPLHHPTPPGTKATPPKARLAPTPPFNKPLHQSPPETTRRHIPDSTFSRSQGHC